VRPAQGSGRRGGPYRAAGARAMGNDGGTMGASSLPTMPASVWSRFVDLPSLASTLAPATTEVDGVEDFIMSFIGWTLMWAALFYFLSYTVPQWAGAAPNSTKDHENDRYWMARNLLGVIHAIFVTAITVPGFFLLSDAPDKVRFGSTGQLATCAATTAVLRPEEIEAWGFLCQAVALAGLVFTSFTVADVGICIMHGLASADFIAHHIAFITAGLIIRSHCMLPFNATMLLAMEASTPFLNFILFFRHRGPAFKFAVQANGIIFVILFVVFRLILNTYGAIVLWLHYATAVAPIVPKWQVWFLLIAVTAGVLVQFFWFPQVVRTFGAGLLELMGRSNSARLDADGSSGSGNEGVYLLLSAGHTGSRSGGRESGRQQCAQ